jgi:hypothetical protein
MVLPSILTPAEADRELLRGVIAALVEVSLGLDALNSGLGLHLLPGNAARLEAVQRDCGAYGRAVHREAMQLLTLLPIGRFEVTDAGRAALVVAGGDS